MKSFLPMCRVSRSILPYISSVVLGIVLIAQAPTHAIGQCAGYSIDVPNFCACDAPDGRAAVTIKVNAPSGQNWTVKAVNGLYSTSSPAAPADPVLIAIGTSLTDIGGGMHTLDARRLTTAGYWVQVTNGACDLDIMVGNPDPCAVPDVCDGVDNDCDNEVDEDAPTWYADTDGDGYGDPNNSTQDCDQPSGYVADNTDCDDGDGDVNPGATEVPGNGLDDDCDPNTPDGCPEIAGLLLVTLPDGSCLYVHPTDNSTSIEWGGYGTDIATLDNITTTAAANANFDGAGNTQKIVTALGAGSYAAKLCADLDAYGSQDWYLPAAGELNAMYQQLGPVGSGQITTGIYWSSSEFGIDFAWGQFFDVGDQYGFNKNSNDRCRCVRR